MKAWKPRFVENSVVPKFLSRFAPITIGAISLGFWVFCNAKSNDILRRHETIHFQQQLELLFVGQWALYLLFWLIGVIKYRDGREAYYQIPFEREAYENQYEINYLENRSRYAWVKYIGDI